MTRTSLSHLIKIAIGSPDKPTDSDLEDIWHRKSGIAVLVEPLKSCFLSCIIQQPNSQGGGGGGGAPLNETLVRKDSHGNLVFSTALLARSTAFRFPAVFFSRNHCAKCRKFVYNCSKSHANLVLSTALLLLYDCGDCAISVVIKLVVCP